ncbi:MAG: hypothetical protein FWG65_13320 [Turicibacter sp.]|nr:hypothetical protein [Turicibacter sp.]
MLNNNGQFIKRMKKSREEEINLTLTNVIMHEDFTFALCAFLDEFKRSERKQHMIAFPPVFDDANKENLCILAAIAHKLANDYNLTIPQWVFEPQYKMPTPTFAFNTTNAEYQAFLIEGNPPEFADKNIFHGSNAIERV